MIGLVISCALSIPVSMDSITNYIQCKEETAKVMYVKQSSINFKNKSNKENQSEVKIKRIM